MPEGYQCDVCGTFDKHTHNMTTVDIGMCADECGRRLEPTYVLCPSCATDIREDIQDVTVPDKIRDEVL